MLRWIGDAIDREAITFSRAHGSASAADAAFDWLGEHYQYLPEEARPQPGQIRAFSNYFGSYVTTSYDLVSEPGKRLKSSSGCYCELCSQLVDISHLQAKKPSKGDTQRAIVWPKVEEAAFAAKRGNYSVQMALIVWHRALHCAWKSAGCGELIYSYSCISKAYETIEKLALAMQ